MRAAAVGGCLAKWGALRAPVSDRVFAVHLGFEFARPASHYGKGRNGAVLRASAPRAKTSRPDVDNLAKAVLDALGAWKNLPPLFWLDDAQVVALAVDKAWAPDGATSGCAITITWTNP
ncbi:MAG: Endodeoxyribonuclease RusA [Planctomycetota bacterium]